jgi:hypothetical protein
MMMVWSNEQIEHWSFIQRAYRADTAWVRTHKDIDQRRQQVQQEMLQLLNAFLEGRIPVKAFNAVFQQKTHHEWNVFGLRGMSGGLFLNKLVKHIPNEEALTQHLRVVLCKPEDTVPPAPPHDTWEGRKRMQRFTQYLQDLISAQHVTRLQLQPARVPFFVSAWWHLQAPERWPIFYAGVRQVLMSDEDAETRTSLQDPVEAYFAFRARFLSLAQALHLSSWELEHLCCWCEQQRRKASPHEEKGLGEVLAGGLSISACTPLSHGQTSLAPTATAHHPMEPRCQELPEDISRAHLQWFLAKLGGRVGCRVWINAEDHQQVWNQEHLGTLSLEALPWRADRLVQQELKQMDVLWFLKREVVAAYEIPRTAKDIASHVLRLYDLGSLFPQREIPLCIVTPSSCVEQTQLELSRPALHRHPMRKHSVILRAEKLVQHEEHILRWANSLAVMKDLIDHCGSEER